MHHINRDRIYREQQFRQRLYDEAHREAADKEWAIKQRDALVGVMGEEKYLDWVRPIDFDVLSWREIGDLYRDKYIEVTR